MNSSKWPYHPSAKPNIEKHRVYWPKISIVTPSYNQGQYIEETILSILNQNYPNLEYIIIDGGSTDNTVEIIEKHADRITYWVSERDQGQADAINKGFKKCTGEIFAYLNSDDCYYPGALFEVANIYLKQKKDKVLLIGNCYWANSFQDTQGWLDKPNFPTTLYLALKKRGLAPQPSMFWTNPLSLRFNEDLKFCMDFEFWLKLILNQYEIERIDQKISLFRTHPNSKTSTLDQIQQEELNGVSSIYKKYLSPTENRDITDFLLFQNQIELYDKIVNLRNVEGKSRWETAKIAYHSKLPITLKLKLFFSICNG